MATPNKIDEATSQMPPFDDVLKQINFDDPQAIKDKSTGKRLAERIYSDQTTNTASLNFFTARAAKFLTLDQWAKGTQDMTQFLDFFNVSDGNKAYVKIDMTPVMIGPQFVGTLVESMTKNDEYACVKAVDDDSIDEKEDRKLEALYRMHEVGTIDKLQQESGVMLEPPNAYVPDDELSAQVYYEQEDRLPKEIRFEKKLQKILVYNQYQKVLKRRFIYDLVVNNIEVGKLEKSGKQYAIRKCIPQNVIYNFFIGDTGKTELKYIGEVYKLKICDLRSKYGKSPARPEGLTEQQLYDMAKMATTKTGVGFSYAWNEQYTNFDGRRPWDDYAVTVFDFEINIQDPEYYVSKVDSFGKQNIAPKKGVPKPVSENATILKREKQRWYRGVYATDMKEIVYWGLPETVIIPYNDTSQSLSSYTINIPFNNGEYVPSLFERAMEPLKEYALTKLKRKQLIAKLRPSGIRIDIESARNIDLGTGDTIPWLEIIKIKDQTGNELWSSRGVDPNQREPPPIGATAVDDTIQKIVQLTTVLQATLMEIRALLGVPNYRDGADVGDRTAAKLADMQNTSSFNVTDFIANAHNQFMEELLYKCCLLSWQDVVKTEPESSTDLINTKFDVEVKMKSTAYEKELLERNIETWSKVLDGDGNPLLSPKDAFRIRSIDNPTSAELYLANVIASNKRQAEASRVKREQANIQSQRASAQDAAKAEQAMQSEKLSMEEQKLTIESKEKKEQILLQGMMDIYKVVLVPKEGSAPVQLPPQVQQLFDMVSQNVAIPLLQENQQMKQQVVMQAQQQQQQADMQEQGQGQDDQEMQEQEQPNEQMYQQ